MNDRISELKQEYFKVSQAKRLMLLCLALAVFFGDHLVAEYWPVQCDFEDSVGCNPGFGSTE